MGIIDSTGHGDELLAELEQLWGLRAVPPTHDRRADGWLIGASVLALFALGCALAALSTADPKPLIVAGVVLALGALAAVRHRRLRAARILRRLP